MTDKKFCRDRVLSYASSYGGYAMFPYMPCLLNDGIILDIGTSEGDEIQHFTQYPNKIIGFEPDVERAKKTQSRFGEMATVLPMAVTNATGSARMGNWGGDAASILCANDTSPTVQTASLKSVVESTGPVALIRMNCEGSEYDILRSIDKDLADKISQISFISHPQFIGNTLYDEELKRLGEYFRVCIKQALPWGDSYLLVKRGLVSNDLLISIPVYAANRIRSLDQFLRNIDKNSFFRTEIILVRESCDIETFPQDELPGFSTMRDYLYRLDTSLLPRLSIREIFLPDRKQPIASMFDWHRRMAEATNTGFDYASTNWVSNVGNCDFYYSPNWDINLLKWATDQKALVPVVLFAYAQSNDFIRLDDHSADNMLNAYWCYIQRVNKFTHERVLVKTRNLSDLHDYYISEIEFLEWLDVTGIHKPNLLVSENGCHRHAISQYAQIIDKDFFTSTNGFDLSRIAPHDTDGWNHFDQRLAGDNKKYSPQDSFCMEGHFPIDFDPAERAGVGNRFFSLDQSIRTS